MIQHSYALYSGLSAGFQKYLEGLQAVHSAVAQAEGARAAGLPVRRKEIETIHPLVRVHPVTGWKSVYVNPGKHLRLKFPKVMLHCHPRIYPPDCRRPKSRIRCNLELPLSSN